MRNSSDRHESPRMYRVKLLVTSLVGIINTIILEDIRRNEKFRRTKQLETLLANFGGRHRQLNSQKET